MALRIGIMGFGRIGRNIFRQAAGRDDVEIVAISDLGGPEAMAYLLTYDTIYGRFPGEVRLDGRYLEAGGQRSRLVRAVRPEDMPWDALGVDVVVEATGKYRGREDLEAHLMSGASRVLVSAPAFNAVDCTVIPGVNDGVLTPDARIVSCASTTGQALCLILKVFHDAFGVEQASVTSVHAYTSDQQLADTVAPDLRRSRSAAENLIPNATWWADLVGQITPSLMGRVAALAVNVPVPNGSNLDLVTQFSHEVTTEDVNAAVVGAAAEIGDYLEVATAPIVSSDVVGNPHTAIFDSLTTMALPGGLVKTITWYDNGWGFAARILETTLRVGALLQEERS